MDSKKEMMDLGDWKDGNHALQSWVFNEILDGMNASIYVTDPETDEILFMNQAMKEAFHVEHPEGKLCWSVLQSGMIRRCEFCPVPLLLEELEEGNHRINCAWEETNTKTGHIYENYDSLMRWVDGRMVHFQHSVDITENKRLYMEVSRDELTGVFSRRAGKKALEALLSECYENNFALTVCMMDVNDMKRVNDTYGHLAGDRLLMAVTAAVRKQLEGRDILLRLGGDEFLAVFVNTKKSQADEKMKTALEDPNLKQLYDSGRGYGSFCFGSLELDSTSELSLGEVLETVDKKLYEQKRQLHITQTGARLAVSKDGGSPKEEKPFVYDSSLLYDALVKSTDDYLYVCNMKTGVFRYSPNVVEEFDLPGQVIENVAAVWSSKVHERDLPVLLEVNQDIIDGREDLHCVEFRARNRKGEWVWLRCRGHVERDCKGTPTLFAGFISNLGKINRIDPLTGLFNQFEFRDQMERLLEKTGGQDITVMLLGIDDMKRANGLYDRSFGDQVIRTVSQRIQSLLPPNSVVCRLDGDQFGVLIRGGSRETASWFYRRIRENFRHQQIGRERKFYCTISAACVFAPEGGTDYERLIKSAVHTLEYAKRRGKDRMEFFSQEILMEKERSMALMELLRDSVEKGFRGFEVYYQPVFSLERKLKGAEALARWSCEPYGMVPPCDFIPLLEESGLILMVGRWIFRKAVETCAEWVREDEEFLMSVNLSYLQLEDPGFLNYIKETLQEFRIEPSHLIVELTESYLASDKNQATELLEQFRLLGMQVAMDDFGTGYSSLGVLKRIPLDVVKVDQAFVRGICDSEFDRGFIRLVVELCHIVGAEICVEGIETEEEFKIIRTMKVNYIQGFLLGRPIPAKSFCEDCLSIENS